MPPNDVPDDAQSFDDFDLIPGLSDDDLVEPPEPQPSDESEHRVYTVPDEPLSAATCVEWSWKAFTANAATWVLATIVFLLGAVIAWSVVSTLLDPIPADDHRLSTVGFHVFIISIPVSIAIGFLGAFLTSGAAKETTPGQSRVDLTDLLHPHRIFAQGLATSCLVIMSTGLPYLGSLIGAIGLAVALVIVVVLDVSMLFLGPIIATTDVNVLNAVRQSFTYSRHHCGHVILVCLMMLGVIVIGALAVGLGLLASVPIVYLAAMFAYKSVSHQPIAAR